MYFLKVFVAFSNQYLFIHLSSEHIKHFQSFSSRVKVL